jgi:hypothetical protein
VNTTECPLGAQCVFIILTLLLFYNISLPIENKETPLLLSFPSYVSHVIRAPHIVATAADYAPQQAGSKHTIGKTPPIVQRLKVKIM